MKYKDYAERHNVGEWIPITEYSKEFVMCAACSSEVPVTLYKVDHESVHLCFICANSYNKERAETTAANHAANMLLLLLGGFDEVDVES